MKLIWASVVAILVVIGGSAAVFAAQPSPKPHGKPSPSPSVQQITPEVSPSPEPSDTPEAGDSNSSNKSNNSGTHPCNHGFYVSQAAHKHAGGAYVSSVAKSDIGKNGSCTAPLPNPPG